MCHYRWHPFLCASQRIPLSVLAQNAHKGHAREISHETGRTRKRRSGQSREGQSTEGRSRDHLTE